jgi:hypothetical protein
MGDDGSDGGCKVRGACAERSTCTASVREQKEGKELTDAELVD